ncbi:hypothetical protein ACFPMF_26760 [Larkinella bovis]|uniref:Uncharacterized protein n=1 Tax=Larkinella bovis TaxID=683041 RepID=A0ABW0IJ72_9BACT
MATLAKTTDLLDETIETLGKEQLAQDNEDGLSLLQKWMEMLKQSENTQALAEKLTRLYEATTQESPDGDTIRNLLNEIADATEEFSGEVGPEGEIPAQLEGLTAALRNLTIQLS